MFTRWTPVKVVLVALILWAVCAILASAGAPPTKGKVVQEVRIWRKGKMSSLRAYTEPGPLPDSLEVVMYRESEKVQRTFKPE